MSVLDKLLGFLQSIEARVSRVEDRQLRRLEMEDARDAAVGRMEASIEELRILLIKYAEATSENRTRMIEEASRTGGTLKRHGEFIQNLEGRVTHVERKLVNGSSST